MGKGLCQVSSFALSVTHEYQNGTLKGSVKKIHMKFLPGLALVCGLISVGHLQKGVAEPKTRSLPRQSFFLSFHDGSRSLFSGLSDPAETCVALSIHCHARLWLCANRYMAPWSVNYPGTLFIQTAVNTEGLKEKKQSGGVC